MKKITLSSCRERVGVRTFTLNQMISNAMKYNPFTEAAKNANSIEEKELALRNFLEQIGDYAPEYARQRLSDMSFLDDCPEWKEKATAILKEYARFLWKLKR